MSLLAKPNKDDERPGERMSAERGGRPAVGAGVHLDSIRKLGAAATVISRSLEKFAYF